MGSGLLLGMRKYSKKTLNRLFFSKRRMNVSITLAIGRFQLSLLSCLRETESNCVSINCNTLYLRTVFVTPKIEI